MDDSALRRRQTGRGAAVFISEDADIGSGRQHSKAKPASLSIGTIIFIATFYVASILITYKLASSGEDYVSYFRFSHQEQALPTTTRKVRDVRLPRHLVPKSYRIELLPYLDPDGNFTFNGKVSVLLHSASSGNNVTLHSRDLQIHHTSIAVSELKSERKIAVTGHSYDEEREFYVIFLGESVKEGYEYQVEMEFEGRLRDDLAGFYRSSYKTPDGDVRWLAVTHFQPTDARRAFPCLDEPALKARFQLVLARRQHMSSVSNMPVTETRPHESLPGYVWDIYETSVPMSTYLVAFMVSDLASQQAEPGLSSTLFRVWARPAAISQSAYARSVGPRVLTYLEDFFQVPFPLPKQDMAALPDFAAGAMENWGLILYRETALLYDPDVSPAAARQRVAEVIAHELAHQWFGNLVTPAWWTDLWLNEGFATYMQCLGTDHVEPEWRMRDQFVTRRLQAVMETDSLRSSHPVSIVVGHPQEIGEIFDSISYLKGAALIRMMEHMLTSRTLRAGLSRYLSEMKYQAAEQDDLWAFLTAQAHEYGTLPSGVSVKDIMDSWTLQTGFPVVHVRRDYASRVATLTQARFLLDGSDDDSSQEEAGPVWYIPLSYTSADAPDFQHTAPRAWMANERQITLADMPSAEGWFVLNVQQVGYFKVNYDRRNWQLLTRQLKTKHQLIHAANRAQLIDDSLDLARAGLVDYDSALCLVSYLDKEDDFLPWDAGFANLEFLKNQLSRSPAYGDFKSFMLALISPLYGRLGQFDSAANSSHITQETTEKLLQWACSLGMESCLREAVQRLNRWMDRGDSAAIPVATKSVIYCTAIANGGEKEWNFLWEKYKTENVAAEKKLLLMALGCSRQLWILNRYLQWTITPGSEIRVQDGATVFQAVAATAVGRYVAWDFLQNNWDRIVQIYASGIFTLQRFISPLKDGFNTPLDLQQLILFRSQHAANLGEARRELDQAIEVSKSNVRWMERNYDRIALWMQKHVTNPNHCAENAV